MVRLFGVLGAALLSGCFLFLGPSVAAAPRPVACQLRAGSTLLENDVVRVYRAHRHTYACERRGGRSRLIGRAEYGSGVDNISRVRLAGHNVGWEQGVAAPAIDLIALDVRSGLIHHSGPQTNNESHTNVTEWILSPTGALAWVEDYDSCVPPYCVVDDKLYVNTVQGTRTVATVHQDGVPPGEANQVRITALGLSDAGGVLYWMASGKPEAARL